MELYAAIDLLDGRAVRLVQGDFGAAREHGDPLSLARRFLAGGASWLHVVDLDAARTGEMQSRQVVTAIACIAHDSGARVEVGGGIRTPADVASLLGEGVDRVVLGTAAATDRALPVECAREHPDRVAVGIDLRTRSDGTRAVAVHGWTAESQVCPAALLEAISDEPVAAVVTTAIERDGTMKGPDMESLSWVLDATGLPVVASGGVGRLEDLEALSALRSPVSGRALAGAVVGRALADGAFGVEEAVRACGASA